MARGKATKLDSETTKCVRPVKYEFTAPELRQLGLELANEVRDGIKLENDKATAMADFTALKKQHQAKYGDLSLKIQNGYEMRDAECIVHLSVPRAGIKTITTLDGAFVAEEQMTPDELQHKLGLDADRPKGGGPDGGGETTGGGKGGGKPPVQ